MQRTLIRRSVALGLALVSSSLGIGTTVAAAQQRIGPHEHFIGLVNGSNDDPTVYTVCAGPTWPGRRGPVAGGQTMSVAEVADGTGYTGPFRQVYAWFAPTKKGSTPTQLKFIRYGRSRAIPDSVRVPCDGTGTAVFSSCPYLAPCASGWVADEVKVQFVNIAV
jgi:hypothetical protein